MNQLKDHVLQLFGEMKKEKLDLHALFEAGAQRSIIDLSLPRGVCGAGLTRVDLASYET